MTSAAHLVLLGKPRLRIRKLARLLPAAQRTLLVLSSVLSEESAMGQFQMGDQEPPTHLALTANTLSYPSLLGFWSPD